MTTVAVSLPEPLCASARANRRDPDTRLGCPKGNTTRSQNLRPRFPTPRCGLGPYWSGDTKEGKLCSWEAKGHPGPRTPGIGRSRSRGLCPSLRVMPSGVFVRCGVQFVGGLCVAVRPDCRTGRCAELTVGCRRVRRNQALALCFCCRSARNAGCAFLPSYDAKRRSDSRGLGYCPLPSSLGAPQTCELSILLRVSHRSSRCLGSYHSPIRRALDEVRAVPFCPSHAVRCCWACGV